MPVEHDADLSEMHAQWEALAGLVEPDEPGWTRRVFSPAYREERSWLLEQFREAGCQHTEIDAHGNIRGVLPGTDPTLEPLVIGSHTDTVEGGGRFDGIVGVLGGLEVVRRLHRGGTPLQRDLVIYDFLGEEANGHGLSCVGSKSLTGTLDTADLARPDHRGLALGDALERSGVRPSAGSPRDVARWHGYLELHIEQSTRLEEVGAQIGVVTGIAGIRRLMTTFIGEQNHAGGARMDQRKDALIAAARSALTVHDFACGAEPFAVGTTTQIENSLDAGNVVPGLVHMRSEIRSPDTAWLDRAETEITRSIIDAAQASGVEVQASWQVDNPVSSCAPSIRDLIIGASEDHGLSWEPVPSGATHDAAHIAALCPTAMIFVPSVEGRSHCPEEQTAWADVAAGVEVLLETARRLDRTADPRSPGPTN